jgi:hypothetical protein
MWAEAIAAISLLTQFPDIKEKWQRLLSQQKDVKPTDENEAFMFALYKEQLITRIICFDLVGAFSHDHSMPKELVEYCSIGAKSAREELEKLKKLFSSGSK